LEDNLEKKLMWQKINSDDVLKKTAQLRIHVMDKKKPKMANRS